MRWIAGSVTTLLLSFLVATGCSGSETQGSGNGGSAPGPACEAVQVNGDCQQCIIKYCKSPADSCFGTGWDTGQAANGPCSDYVNCITTNGCSSSTCASKNTEDCERCLEMDIDSCLTQNCNTQCG